MEVSYCIPEDCQALHAAAWFSSSKVVRVHSNGRQAGKTARRDDHEVRTEHTLSRAWWDGDG